MKRACGKVGKTSGWRGGRTPLQAICRVVQIALRPVARARIRVMSPTTLMSVLTGGPPACLPGGLETGEMATPWMSQPAAYGLTAATVRRLSAVPGAGAGALGAWMIAIGWFGSTVLRCLRT